MEIDLAHKILVAANLRHGLTRLKALYRGLLWVNPLTPQWFSLAKKQQYDLDWAAEERESRFVQQSRSLWAKIHTKRDYD